MGELPRRIRENTQPDNFLAEILGLRFRIVSRYTKQDNEALPDLSDEKLSGLPGEFSINRDLRLTDSLDNGTHGFSCLSVLQNFNS